MQLYERKVAILLNTVLKFKTKHINKGAIAPIDRKLGKPTSEPNLSEDPNI